MLLLVTARYYHANTIRRRTGNSNEVAKVVSEKVSALRRQLSWNKSKQGAAPAILRPERIGALRRRALPSAADNFKDVYSLEFVELANGCSQADLHAALLRKLGHLWLPG